MAFGNVSVVHIVSFVCLQLQESVWKIESCFITLLHKKNNKKVSPGGPSSHVWSDCRTNTQGCHLAASVEISIISHSLWQAFCLLSPARIGHFGMFIMCIVYCSNMSAPLPKIQVNTQYKLSSLHCLDNHCLILLDLIELRPAVLLEIIRTKAYCLTMVVLAHLEVRLAKPCESMPTTTDGKRIETLWACDTCLH